MAGAIVVTTTKVDATSVTKYSVTWISDAAGNVSGSTFAMKIGTIIQVEFIPGTGLTQPDNLYDADMTDEEGVSMFDNGAGTTIGANLSNVASLHALPMIGTAGAAAYRRWHHGGPVQPLVAGAGDTNSGVIDIYVMDGVV